jgi:CspA family cold shock protein
MKGTIKFFNGTKGFGFITPEEGKDVFVHMSALQPGTRLNEGDKVTFEVEEDDRGQKATNVKKETEETTN